MIIPLLQHPFLPLLLLPLPPQPLHLLTLLQPLIPSIQLPNLGFPPQYQFYFQQEASLIFDTQPIHDFFLLPSLSLPAQELRSQTAFGSYPKGQQFFYHNRM
jgi:hypothetical protein